MDEFQHSLYFEAKDLTDRDKEKTRRYFQKRRESGGGECGNIENIGSNIFKISFKEKEDQERVLQRKFHKVSLPDGELHLTVSRTSSTQAPDQPSTSQSQTSTKVNTKGLEKIFKIDIFLLYYLKDNPKASKLLTKQLSAIGCTVKLDFDEEEAVVSGDIEKGPGGAFGGAAEKWELQVDQVFVSLMERYLCYHVMEPKQVKKLLQDPSFATDDVKVYKESGYAVVVGEKDVVKEKIAALEKSLPIQKNLPVVEKQFKLVEEEFSREMRACFPEVTIFRQSGMISLEGLDQEVQSAAAKLDELINNIKEKRVQLSAALITFLTSSRAISKYQTRFQQSLRSPVSLDVGSDLVLSSLSSDALEEAAAAVLRDVSVATVELQGAAAVAPDLDRLKEILIKAKNDTNLSELRVDVSFIPGPSGTIKVQLVGYTYIVNTLQHVLCDFQMNQVVTQEVLDLPLPVDCFDKILVLIGMKQTKVTLTTSHFPNPSVLLSGPRCHVQEAKQALMAALATLTSNILDLDGPGAQRYFQTDGKVSKELVESSCQVVIRILHTSSTSQQSVFLFLGLSGKDVNDAMEKLKNLYQTQCSTQTFKKEELTNLTQDNMQDLMQMVNTQGLCMKKDAFGNLTVSGLKDGVNQARQIFNEAVQNNLMREMRVREGEDLFSRVTWCIQGHNGNWEKLPKTANHHLETKNIAAEIVDAQGMTWKVDLQRMEVSMSKVGLKRKLKRLENVEDFALPLYWDSMTADEGMKVVTLEPSTREYQAVKEAFNRTVSKAVMKIERLQNVHLRRTYEAHKKHISDKNRQRGGAREMLLYHGTTRDNCDSIMKTGFNRSFAGQHAASYGLGTYFAVNASYSADPGYSRPANDGFQLVFVARVLTGVYTQGNSSMVVPPQVEGSQEDHDRYDSVVDRMDNPSMYVVFHDSQAYPDYLITFC